MNKTTPDKEKIREEFSKVWGELITQSLIADWWLDKMEAQKAESEKESDELTRKCGELESQVKKAWEGGRKEMKADTIAIIDKMKIKIPKKGVNGECKICGTDYYENCICKGYNSALNEILSILRKER